MTFDLIQLARLSWTLKETSIFILVFIRIFEVIENFTNVESMGYSLNDFLEYRDQKKIIKRRMRYLLTIR